MTAPALNGRMCPQCAEPHSPELTCNFAGILADNAKRTARLPLDIRPPRLADLPYVRNSFAEGHKGAPGVSSMTWRHYNRFIRPQLSAVLSHPRVELAAAYIGADIVGWLAYTIGRNVDAVHWAHTRFKVGDDGAPLRRRGVMTALFDAVELRRLEYTWRAGRHKDDRDKRTVDERLLPWLSRRGHHATYTPWESWIQ